MTARGKETTLAAALAELKARIEPGATGKTRASRGDGPLPSRLAALAQTAGLDRFETALLLLAALPALEPEGER